MDDIKMMGIALVVGIAALAFLFLKVDLFTSYSYTKDKSDSCHV